MTTPEQLRELVATSIAKHGLRETARRLELATDTVLRIATPGVAVRRGSLALVQVNAHLLQESPT